MLFKHPENVLEEVVLNDNLIIMKANYLILIFFDNIETLLMILYDDIDKYCRPFRNIVDQIT